MLSKKKRLNRTAFSRFFASGRRISSPYFQLVYTPHQSFFGSVVVGKKVFKKAVQRNRLRRQIYAVLYREYVANSLQGVYIIIVRSSAGTLCSKQLIEAVRSVLKQI